MRRVVIAAVALLVLGCAGWGRDFDARLRLDEADLPPLKIQCDSAPVPDVAVVAMPVVVHAPTESSRSASSSTTGA